MGLLFAIQAFWQDVLLSNNTPQSLIPIPPEVTPCGYGIVIPYSLAKAAFVFGPTIPSTTN